MCNKAKRKVMRAVNMISALFTGTLGVLLMISAADASEERNKEVNCLALNIYHESRGETTMGQIAVAHVTLNRVADKRWPDNICDVVYQPKQFSWTHMINNKTPKSDHNWEVSQSIASDVMDGVDEDNTYGAVYYHAKRANPIWNRKLTITTKIGAHIFYKD
jgi:N-acetylmuramoyl-L-alanine amidase